MCLICQHRRFAETSVVSPNSDVTSCHCRTRLRRVIRYICGELRTKLHAPHLFSKPHGQDYCQFVLAYTTFSEDDFQVCVNRRLLGEKLLWFTDKDQFHQTKVYSWTMLLPQVFLQSPITGSSRSIKKHNRTFY